MDARWTPSGVCAALLTILPAAGAAQSNTSRAPAGGALPEAATTGCAGSLRDQATGGCVQASSTPQPGMLFPPPHDGGVNNSSTGSLSYVGGGQWNSAESTWSTVAGGYHNEAEENADTVGGGFDNRAGGSGSTVGGGILNVASGYGSVVPGGGQNVAAGAYSFAAGVFASADHQGSFVWSDASFSGMSSSANNQFLINASGGVGIGTNDVSGQMLKVAGPVHSSGPSGGTFLAFNPNNAGASMHLSWKNDVARIRVGGNGPGANGGFDFQRVGDQSIMRLLDNRNVGIGTTLPSERLSVVGNICATGTIGSCSDERFKSDIEDLEDALDTVLALRGVEFDWRRDEFPEREFSADRQVGLIAQEVLEVLPALVSEGSDGMYSVDYARLTPLLIEALREQQGELDRQRDEVQRQRRDLTRLGERLADVSARLQCLVEPE